MGASFRVLITSLIARGKIDFYFRLSRAEWNFDGEHSAVFYSVHHSILYSLNSIQYSLLCSLRCSTQWFYSVVYWARYAAETKRAQTKMN